VIGVPGEKGDTLRIKFECSENVAVWEQDELPVPEPAPSRGRAKGSTTTAVTGLPYNVAYGYATTVHKAQGSEFKHVLALVSGPRQSKKSLYTAFSRARQTLEVVGMLDAIPWIMRRDEETERTTVLRAIFAKPRPAGIDIAARLAALRVPEPEDGGDEAGPAPELVDDDDDDWLAVAQDRGNSSGERVEA